MAIDNALVGLLTSEQRNWLAFSSSRCETRYAVFTRQWLESAVLKKLGYSGGAVPESHRSSLLRRATRTEHPTTNARNEGECISGEGVCQMIGQGGSWPAGNWGSASSVRHSFESSPRVKLLRPTNPRVASTTCCRCCEAMRGYPQSTQFSTADLRPNKSNNLLCLRHPDNQLSEPPMQTLPSVS